jgi:alkylation response protein AidB-like acyl-CoA dehydrogenase
MADWMVTTAIPVGENEPAMFILDVKDRPWDGSAGLRLLHEWDGVGMAATQSHGMCLEDIPAVRFGHDRPLTEMGLAANPLILTLFSAVIVGVLDEAIAVARVRLEPRRHDLRAFEQVEWTASERRYWLAQQALVGSIAAVQADDPLVGLHGALRAKQSIAELAEQILTGLCRVIGGGTFSRRSPFSHWLADVRALGFLRPPWALADDKMFETSW